MIVLLRKVGTADAEGNLFFSDCPNNRIMIYRPATGETTVWKEPSGRANGMNFDPQGLWWSVAMAKTVGQGPCSVMSLTGQLQPSLPINDGKKLINDGKKLNAPNDLCFDRQGRIYFTESALRISG